MKTKCLHICIFSVIATLAVTLFSACSIDRYVSNEEALLAESRVTSTEKEVLKEIPLRDYIQQTPNSTWFGARIPLRIYCLSGHNDRVWMNKVLKRLGEAPVIYDSTKAVSSAENMRQLLANSGYFHSQIDVTTRLTKRGIKVNYHIKPNERYYINNVERRINDEILAQDIAKDDSINSGLHQGVPFSVELLDRERNRITDRLRSIGYYKFTKQNITFDVDTASGSNLADVTLNVSSHLENGRSLPESHRQFRIGNVKYYVDVNKTDTTKEDTVVTRGDTIIYNKHLFLRPGTIFSSNALRKGAYYSDATLRQTYNNYTRLSAISFSNINLHQRANTDTLDCEILINHSRPHSLSFDIEATNSAGDLGAAASASYTYNNLFRGSENFMISVRGGYEAITRLEGYEGGNYFEVGGEMRLSFPNFLLPFVNRRWGMRHAATSEISLQYNLQNRPEFNRRVLTGAWRYRWNSHEKRATHKFDLLEVNYVFMPWISKTFREQYLDSLGKTNAILKYNYENLLITKLGYTFTYNSLGSREQIYGKNAWTFRFNIETSGNLLRGFTSLVNGKKDSNGNYTFCGIAYAQYVRGDIDFARSVRIDKRNSLAFHAALGIAYPYGNSTILPFEKRYYAGGANSVRGWSVRSLGPGTYNGVEKGINFINQSGDIKLDLSFEYRVMLFWKISGAAFIDAGNIWTIRKYEDQPGGEFRFDKFWQQIAASYGLGLRLSLDFFTLRFDAGMKAINPAYTGRDQFPIYHPKFSRDFAFHFAVGMPF